MYSRSAAAPTTRGFLAFEFKSGSRIRETDLKPLLLFGQDYPESKRILVYSGTEARELSGVSILPSSQFFEGARELLLKP
jgi:hypothetical protein